MCVQNCASPVVETHLRPGTANDTPIRRRSFAMRDSASQTALTDPGAGRKAPLTDIMAKEGTSRS